MKKLKMFISLLSHQTCSVAEGSCMTHFLQHRDVKWGYSVVASFILFLFTAFICPTSTNIDNYAQLFGGLMSAYLHK